MEGSINMTIVKGGSFLLTGDEPENIFTPEDFSEEHIMMGKTAKSFVEGEVIPHLEELEQLDCALMKSMLEKAGELGLLSADVPENFGGMELDKISSIIITENIARGGSFILAHGAHTGIGSLPIVYFGNQQQQERYLPDLASGEKIAAYALTEPGAGSDALAAKTKAVLSEDGKYYILNGSKQFITNAGMADVFVTYAKIDGEKFTAFIVDREAEGVSIGAEEKKMGIKGSSTCSVIFEDAKIPVENLLGEMGKGHVIAFNILNIGRYKLAAGCIGTAKIAINESLKYAAERTQFGVPINSFELIKEKIALMATKTYVGESMLYRTAGAIEDRLKEIDMSQENSGQLIGAGIEEYAIECSINKVFGSEVLDFVADEAVQIHGGYGYTQEYLVERIYRDSRINRIFEGTNEINRLIIPATIMRKAMKGELPLLPAAQKLLGEIISMMPGREEQSLFGNEQNMLHMSKKIFLMCAGTAVQKFGNSLKDQQMILIRVADLVIGIYALESALLRTTKAVSKTGEEKNMLKILMTQYYFSYVFPKLDLLAKEILAATETGDMLRTQLSALKKLSKNIPVNQAELVDKISAQLIKYEKYSC
jgi:alkylation response protein AidB-like acyl-CoA dehydrogenase